MARRRFQHGSAVLRGSVWYGRYWDGEPRHRISVRLGTKEDFPTKRLALRVLEPLLAEVNSPLYRPLQIINFKQFTQRWEERMYPELKRSTVLAYRSVLRSHLEPYFGQVRVQDISPEMVQGFVASYRSTCSLMDRMRPSRPGRDNLAAPVLTSWCGKARLAPSESHVLSPKTIRNALMLLKAMLRDAIRWGYLRANPCEAIRLPHAIPPDRPAFTLDEVRAILTHAQEPYRTLYWLAFETGMRAGELCGLRAEDVNVQKCLVQVRQSVWRGRVQTPKSQAAYRDIFISQTLTDQLQSLVRQGAEPPMHFLFHTRTGSAWDANAITKKRLAPLCKTLGIETKGLHAFRRTHATMMDRLGVPLKVRQERMGHTDPRLTLTAYTQPVSEDERRFVTQLARTILPIDLDANRLQKEKAEVGMIANFGP